MGEYLQFFLANAVAPTPEPVRKRQCVVVDATALDLTGSAIDLHVAPLPFVQAKHFMQHCSHLRWDLVIRISCFGVSLHATREVVFFLMPCPECTERT